MVGVGEVHAAFLNESRTRGRVQRSEQEIRGRPWRVQAGTSAKEFLPVTANRRKSVDAASLTRKLHKITGRKIAPAVKMLQGLGAAMGTTGGAWRKGIHVLVQAAGKRD